MRSGQYEFHRARIDRRCLWPTVRHALNDDMMLELLYETLQRWGIVRRASRLIPLEEFRAALRARANDIAAFEHFRLDDRGTGMEEVAARLWPGFGLWLWPVVEKLGIVRNASLIVPGSKALHHLLPDLVPPMDRAWTGAFFLWSAAAPQTGQQTTFIRTLTWCAEIAREANSSRYVGDGWRTSTSKVVDNAIIGYGKAQGIRPSQGR